MITKKWINKKVYYYDTVNKHFYDFCFSLNVLINWDNSFASRFGGDALNAMRRVAAHAADMYQWPTIATKLNWNIQNGGNIGITLQADENYL